MEKQIVIKISIDCEKDEWGNVINLQGFEDGKPIQNTAELIGWLELTKQQELKRVCPKQTKKE